MISLNNDGLKGLLVNFYASFQNHKCVENDFIATEGWVGGGRSNVVIKCNRAIIIIYCFILLNIR